MYSFDTESRSVVIVKSFMKIICRRSKFVSEGTYTATQKHTHSRQCEFHKPTYFFQNKKSRLNIGAKTLHVFPHVWLT
jgi:hypothetical protein